MPLKSPKKKHIFSPHPVAPAALLPGPLAAPGHRARGARPPRRAGAAAAGRAAAVAPRRDGRLGEGWLKGPGWTWRICFGRVGHVISHFYHWIG